MRTAAAVALVTLAAAVAPWLGWPTSAGAHGESSPLIKTVVDGITPADPAVRASTQAGPATTLQLTNDSPSVVEVIAPAGEAFIRISHAGTYANVSSPEWYRSGNPDGVGRFPPGIVPGSPPRWVLISKEPTLTWFEHRLHPAPVGVPPSLVGSQRRQRLSDWSVPIRIAGAPGRISGHTDYRPLFGAVTAEVVGSPQPLPGVLMYVLPGPVPGLFLESTRHTPVLVRGRAGEPFVRIGPNGVEANQRSPSFHDDQGLKGDVPATPADPTAPPLWRKVGTAPRYGWLDTRARYGPGQPPDAVVDRPRRTVLTRWTVPIESGSSRAVVAGATSWVPAPRPGTAAPRGDSSSLVVGLGLGAVLVGVGVVAAVALRRRRA